jgi:hypothetical protein
MKGKKWSDRIRRALRAAGKPHDDAYIQLVKARLAEQVKSKGWKAVHPKKSGPLDSLVASLEAKIA